jgi:hypothetical protein
MLAAGWVAGRAQRIPCFAQEQAAAASAAQNPIANQVSVAHTAAANTNGTIEQRSLIETHHLYEDAEQRARLMVLISNSGAWLWPVVRRGQRW